MPELDVASKKMFRLFHGFHVGGNVRMKNQIQAKVFGHLGSFRNHPGHLFPLIRVPAFAAVSGNSPCNSVPLFRLCVGKHQKRRPQSGKQPTHLTNMLHDYHGRSGIAEHCGNERSQELQLPGSEFTLQDLGIGRQEAVWTSWVPV